MLRALTTLVTLLLLPAVAGAQGPAPLTLDEAIALALERNPAMRIAGAGRDAAEARVSQARAGYFPRVDVIEGWQHSNQPVFVFSSLLMQRQFTVANFALEALNHPSPISNYRAAIVLEQPIFDGFQAKSATRIAQLGSDAASLDREIAAASLRLQVVQAYGRAAGATAALRTEGAALETAREDVRRADARRDAGIETEANVLAFRVHAAGAEARRVRAVADERVARAALNALIAAPLDDPRPLAAVALPAATAVDASTLEHGALTKRPELRQAALRREQARAGGSLAKASLMPQVAFQGAAEADGGTYTDRASAWSMGVQVRWNVFAGGADKARVTEAAANARRADAEIEQLETAVRLEVRTAIANHQSALDREAVSRQVVEQALESRRIIRDRYDAGLAPASEVLRAAELVAQAEAGRTAAIIDVHVTAAALERASGGA